MRTVDRGTSQAGLCQHSFAIWMGAGMEWNREISVGWIDRILDGFERMAVTRANYWAAFAADLGMCVGLITLSLYRRDMHLMAAVLTFLAGLFLFSLVEYSFHRWLFHGPEHAMERGHRRHHQSPVGIDSLPFFLPPVALLVIVGVLNLAMPTSYALLLTVAIAGGYFAYGQCHDWIHRTRFQNGLARKWAASHHVHHFHPDHNFGVTSPLWDILLGTRYVSGGGKR
jgi:sterol desaturase/sphingolipid hydroxylase (fatty acid hydroxylase superfamily)